MHRGKVVAFGLKICFRSLLPHLISLFLLRHRGISSGVNEKEFGQILSRLFSICFFLCPLFVFLPLSVSRLKSCLLVTAV